jgi:hypothetical protein
MRAFFESTTRDFLMYLDAPGDPPNWLAQTVKRRFDAQVLYTSFDLAIVRFNPRTTGARE